MLPFLCTKDFTEFLIAISVTAQGDAKKKLSMAFKMYDMDKNGRVDKKGRPQHIPHTT
jgi:Ca2+-binding EF-hand superfamily protein